MSPDEVSQPKSCFQSQPPCENDAGHLGRCEHARRRQKSAACKRSTFATCCLAAWAIQKQVRSRLDAKCKCASMVQRHETPYMQGPPTTSRLATSKPDSAVYWHAQGKEQTNKETHKTQQTTIDKRQTTINRQHTTTNPTHNTRQTTHNKTQTTQTHTRNKKYQTTHNTQQTTNNTQQRPSNIQQTTSIKHQSTHNTQHRTHNKRQQHTTNS